MTEVDVLVVGAGPAGSSAARVVAAEGWRVLLVERRPTVGLPVQCAEYVPAQIVSTVSMPERSVAQHIRKLRTHLPDGQMVETAAAGYVLDRATFDKSLAVAAGRAGAEVWTGARATEWTEPGAVVRRANREVEVACQVIVGADGPRSTVGRWIGQTNESFIDGAQVEVVLPVPQDFTAVYFDPAYRGGYGWLFPKGETANVGVGVNRHMGGDAGEALGHLLERLKIGPGAVVGRTGGPVPSGGRVDHLHQAGILLVGDAAGLTHPVTGAGIFPAVVSGVLAGQAIARALESGDLAVLDRYEEEWTSFMGGPQRHALSKRRHLDAHWSDDPQVLSDLVRQTWVAFKAYARRGGRDQEIGQDSQD